MRRGVAQHLAAVMWTAVACLCLMMLFSACSPSQNRLSESVAEQSVASAQEEGEDEGVSSKDSEEGEDGAAAGAASSSATAAGSATSSAAATPSFDVNAYKRNEALEFSDIPADYVIDVSTCKDLASDSDTILRIVDTREPATFKKGSIEGAVCIPAGWQVVSRVGEVGKKATVVLVGQQNENVAAVRQTFIDLDVPKENILVLNGGIDAWVAAGYPLEENQNLSCC